MSECNCCNELKNEIAGYQQVMKHNMQELKENNETTSSHPVGSFSTSLKSVYFMRVLPISTNTTCFSSIRVLESVTTQAYLTTVEARNAILRFYKQCTTGIYASINTRKTLFSHLQYNTFVCIEV